MFVHPTFLKAAADAKLDELRRARTAASLKKRVS